ncbi:MAG: hypothetical protein Q4E45_08785, partial [Eubacteriales bacterium]|nr:hypothetical protein [Eubacteriales bacterium]
EPTPDPEAEAMAEVEAARALFDEGEYYEAFMAAVSCKSNWPDTQAAEECDALTAEISSVCNKEAPKTGTELERTFQYQGGCQLKVIGKSGALLVHVEDAKNPSQYSTFYVREGETGTINLTAGSYTVSWELGHVWFGEETGFGDFAEPGSLNEDLQFNNSTAGGWVSNSVWTLTIYP